MCRELYVKWWVIFLSNLHIFKEKRRKINMINWSWLLLWSLVFPKVELESSRMSKTRRRRIGLRTKCWRFQTLPPNAVHLWLHSAFSGWTAHKTARKTCCFLCWAQSDCHKCSWVFMFPEKNRCKNTAWEEGWRFLIQLQIHIDMSWFMNGYQVTWHEITWRLVFWSSG